MFLDCFSSLTLFSEKKYSLKKYYSNFKWL